MCRSLCIRSALGMAFTAWSGLCAGAGFGNDVSGYAWADTPQGKFECRNDRSTNQLQLLKVGGRIVFQEKPGPDGILEGDTLVSGIEHRNVGCPSIIANERGYVVVVRDTQPPKYGLQGYAVIDFNKRDPALIALAEGQRPQDDRIPDKRRLEWSDKRLKLRYFGYAPDESGGSLDSPKPRAYELHFEFASGEVKKTK